MNQGRKQAPAKSEVACSQRYFAIAAPGLEEAVAREVAQLKDVRDVECVTGGVNFSGPLEVLYRANLHLRVASRVLARVGEIQSREFSKLRRAAAKFPWENYVGVETNVDTSASASRCRLYHTGALAENLSAAVDDRLGRKPRPVDAEADPSALKLLVRGEHDRFTLSVDSSGELLHRRGWRTEQMHAPMRETLAAAILMLSEWAPLTPLVDPMCGSGTIPIEACAMSMGVAPGISRSFAFERWPSFDSTKWNAVRAEATAEQHANPSALILGSDESARAIAMAKSNAARAGLLSQLTFEHRSLRDLVPLTETGLLIANPPYGERLGNETSVRTLYRDLGSVLRERFSRFRAAILVPEKQTRLAGQLGHPSRCFKLRNGGIRLQLWCLPPFRA